MRNAKHSLCSGVFCISTSKKILIRNLSGKRYIVICTQVV